MDYEVKGYPRGVVCTKCRKVVREAAIIKEAHKTVYVCESCISIYKLCFVFGD